MGQKILVTGGAGFIGTHLCRALVKAGHTVHVLDCEKPKHFVEGVQYLTQDVRDSGGVRQAMQGVQAVYHFAAHVGLMLCQENPLESYQTNVLSTAIVAEAALQESNRQGSPVRFIFSGSAAVYGNSGQVNQALDENALLPPPLSFYGAQKLASEQMIRLFHLFAGLHGIVFRFFNVYGEGQDPLSPYSSVISVFQSAIQQGLPLQLHGGGHQTRDFISVYSIVDACLRALTLPLEKCDGLPINLGSGCAQSISQLAEVMIKVFQNKSTIQKNNSNKIEYKKIECKTTPAREGDVLHSKADISRALAILSWAPQISFTQGLSELF